MKKRVLSIVLVVVIVFSICTPVYAAENADTIHPSLSFSGDTAYCSVTITAVNKYIDATLQLWEEGTLIASWSESDTHYISIHETYPAISGWNYTLTVSGTIGGDPIDTDPINGICPLTRSTP